MGLSSRTSMSVVKVHEGVALWVRLHRVRTWHIPCEIQSVVTVAVWVGVGLKALGNMLAGAFPMDAEPLAGPMAGVGVGILAGVKVNVLSAVKTTLEFIVSAPLKEFSC